MSTSAFCYQFKAHHLCAESSQHGLSELAGCASPFQRGGWPRVSNAACLGMLRISHLGRSSYYHRVKARAIATSNGCVHDVIILSPASSRPSENRGGYTRALRQCNALPSSKGLFPCGTVRSGGASRSLPSGFEGSATVKWQYREYRSCCCRGPPAHGSDLFRCGPVQFGQDGAVEGDEECAIIFRSAVQSRFDNATTLERVIFCAVDRSDLDEELLHEADRITGALQIGVVGCRRSASWICFGGGARPRRKRAWKTTNRKGSFAKARKLVDTITQLPSAKEEIYGALDAFVAWELEFPIIAIKKALQFMAEEKQWKPVIQVSKWMLSKGQGRTLGTYTLLLEALDHEGRVEEADALWEKILTEHEEVTPRMMFTVVIAMFERHNQPKRLLQVFADMEELEVKPDMVTVERVARTYRSLGLMKRADAVEAKYPPTKWGYRYSKKGKKYRIRVTADGQIIKPENSSQSESDAEEDGEADGEEEDSGDSDSDDNDQFINEGKFVEENPFSLNSDNVLPSVGH